MSTTATTEHTRKVRIPERFRLWLAGSEVWTQPDSPAMTTLVDKLKTTPVRKDRSQYIEITPAEAGELDEWSGYLMDCTRESAGTDPDSRADYNAAVATMRQSRKPFGPGTR